MPDPSEKVTGMDMIVIGSCPSCGTVSQMIEENGEKKYRPVSNARERLEADGRIDKHHLEMAETFATYAGQVAEEIGDNIRSQVSGENGRPEPFSDVKLTPSTPEVKEKSNG